MYMYVFAFRRFPSSKPVFINVSYRVSARSYRVSATLVVSPNAVGAGNKACFRHRTEYNSLLYFTQQFVVSLGAVSVVAL